MANAAAIDEAKVVWASDLGDTQNVTLINYYPDREIWLLDSQQSGATLSHLSRALKFDGPVERSSTRNVDTGARA